MRNWQVLMVAGFLLLILVATLFLAHNVTLFEDGSVQFFHQPGCGFCLVKAWGCS